MPPEESFIFQQISDLQTRVGRLEGQMHERSIWDQIPIRSMVIWLMAIVTLGLATSGWLNWEYITDAIKIYKSTKAEIIKIAPDDSLKVGI